MTRFSLAKSLFTACALAAVMSAPARAQSEASAALSMLPLASVVGAASVGGAAVGASAALPVALLIGGAVLAVKAVEASANGTVYLLERASDGAQASVRVSSRAADGASLAMGTAVFVSIIGAGALLSVAGEVIAFVPNALGKALLHHEQVK